MATKKSLEAAAATSGMFTEAKETKTATKATKEPVNKVESKAETVPYSCRMDTDTIARWKAYVKVEGYGNMGEMTKQAITEYMKAHPLTKDKKAKYQALYEVSKM